MEHQNRNSHYEFVDKYRVKSNSSNKTVRYKSNNHVVKNEKNRRKNGVPISKKRKKAIKRTGALILTGALIVGTAVAVFAASNEKFQSKIDGMTAEELNISDMEYTQLQNIEDQIINNGEAEKVARNENDVVLNIIKNKIRADLNLDENTDITFDVTDAGDGPSATLTIEDVGTLNKESIFSGKNEMSEKINKWELDLASNQGEATRWRNRELLEETEELLTGSFSLDENNNLIYTSNEKEQENDQDR